MEFLLGPLLQQVGPLIIAAVVPAVVAGFKKVWPKMPNLLKPLTAAVIGPATDILLAKLAGVPATGVVSVLIGLAGVGIREIVVQIKQATTEA